MSGGNTANWAAKYGNRIADGFLWTLYQYSAFGATYARTGEQKAAAERFIQSLIDTDSRYFDLLSEVQKAANTMLSNYERHKKSKAYGEGEK
jgi:hypothetical protein